jgi:hypothetical protein
MAPAVRQQCLGLSMFGRCHHVNPAINTCLQSKSTFECQSAVSQRRTVRSSAPAAAAVAAVPVTLGNSAVAAFPGLQAVLEPLLPYVMAAAAAYCALLMLLVSACVGAGLARS